MIELTCIVCPKGCRLRVDDQNGYKVTGNICARGEAYGREEALDPKRTVTSTVRILFERHKGAHPPVAPVAPAIPQPLPLVSYFRPDAPQIEARLPVKTSAPVPKASIMDVMREVNRITVRGPARLGDVIAANIAGTGVDLLATRTMTGPEGSR